MGQLRPPADALLLLAAFSRHAAALEGARQRAIAAWGPLAAESPRFDFAETDYYSASMGAGLKKTFFVFERPFDQGALPAVKRLTNDWEAECAASGDYPEPRPLNLDPGYLTLAKLVLASTKDHAHRLYLGEGIYAEVTLYYSGGGWNAREWTYADYRRDDYQRFFTDCRQRLYLRRGGSR